VVIVGSASARTLPIGHDVTPEAMIDKMHFKLHFASNGK